MRQLNYQVPFFPNTSNNLRCFQACLKMVAKYFQPERNYSWNRLDVISGFVPHKGTWPLKTMLWLSRNSFVVKDIEIFDYRKFIDQKGEYLKKFYSPEIGEAQIKSSNLDQEIGFAKKLIDADFIDYRLPTNTDFPQLLKQGYLIICNVNSEVLNHKSGYTGHFIVVKGVADGKLIIHDPGLPPHKDWSVDYQFFLKAWAYPGAKSKNLLAIKKT